MNRTESDAILKLSIEERLRRVELIWRSIAATPFAVPLGDAHRAVIDDRLAEHARAPNDVLSRRGALAEARRGETAAARHSPTGRARSGRRK